MTEKNHTFFRTSTEKGEGTYDTFGIISGIRLFGGADRPAHGPAAAGGASGGGRGGALCPAPADPGSGSHAAAMPTGLSPDGPLL